jgi:hypothetical protein
MKGDIALITLLLGILDDALLSLRKDSDILDLSRIYEMCLGIPRTMSLEKAQQIFVNPKFLFPVAIVEDAKREAITDISRQWSRTSMYLSRLARGTTCEQTWADSLKISSQR